MNQAVAGSFYTSLPLESLTESDTNPRRTFDADKLVELATSIQSLGLLQPIMVRPIGEHYEIVAGARRFRAAKIAELATMPVFVCPLTDEQALEAQIVENSQRQDVHPYEEAAGYRRLMELPGYDAGALAAKCGKSLSHVYARLALLNLIPAAVDAFQQEQITAAHANQLARLSPAQQELAFPQCWRRDFRDGQMHLLAARNLAIWIRENLCLPLAEAPFSREDSALVPEAGACTDCPKRTGYNTALFCDFQDDQCLDSTCYQAKVEAHITRELEADSELLQIETRWRPVSEIRVGAIAHSDYWPLKETSPECDTIQRAIIVFGQDCGTKIRICSDRACPIHNHSIAQAIVQDRARAEQAARNAPPPLSEEEQEARRQKQAAYDAEQERLEQERQEERRKREAAEQAHRKEREDEEAKRAAKLARMVKRTPEMLSAPQLRILLCALLNADIFGQFSRLAAELTKEGDDDRRDSEEVLTSIVETLPDKELSGFAVRLALGWYSKPPFPGTVDYLTEAEGVFLPKLAVVKKPAPKQRKA